MVDEKHIEELLSKMTVEEKVGQMQQIAVNMRDKQVLKEFTDMGTVGSFLCALGDEKSTYEQPCEESRLKIPAIFGIDAIHGHALLKGSTVFPSQLALACTFNDGLVENVGYITAKEVAADGLDWVFSPVLCLGRDLRWGRIDETFGEDWYLASRLGSAIIKGYQTDNLVAACAKHYLAYGEATGGRDAYNVEITERYAREIFLKPFKAAVDAGCMTFMTSYGSIDGKPLTVSRRWLTEILKEELGFNGFIVTDWMNYSSLITGQRVAENMEEACVDGVMAGNDMAMTTYEFYEHTVKAVKDGKIPESVINDSVRRILRVKSRLGLLDGMRIKPPKNVIGCAEHQKFNYKTAVESAVLLKNNGALPLANVQRIAVIGPNADDVRAQYGDWTYFSHPNAKDDATAKDDVYTILKGIKEVFGEKNVSYAMGCTIDGSDDEDILVQNALSVAERADTVILVLGDNLNWNGENKDICNYVLRGRQLELAREISELGKRIICVLVNGKPLVLSELENYCDGIIETFNGGDMCGLAVANLIKGKENFSGKLPISFPNQLGSTPNYYSQYDYWHGKKYKDIDIVCKYPFGFGLSYSKFTYSEISADKMNVGKDGCIKLTVTVDNESDIDGTETVQLYFRDKVCKMLTPVRQLIDYKKIFIPAHGNVVAEFAVAAGKLGYYEENCKYTVDAGEFEFYVSGDGKSFKMITVTVI